MLKALDIHVIKVIKEGQSHFMVELSYLVESERMTLYSILYPNCRYVKDCERVRALEACEGVGLVWGQSISRHKSSPVLG